MAKAVKGTTISPQITKNNDGTSLVTFPVWGSGVYSAITVENCEQDGSGCYVLDFFANFGKQPSLNAAWMNAWNDQFYIARVYPLSNGEVVFTADLAILTGVTPDYVTAFAGFFKQVVDNASTFKGASQVIGRIAAEQGEDGGMRLVTWNINSVRLRADNVCRLLERGAARHLCLQETKTPDELFPREPFEALGYGHIEMHGMKGYNGVAILAGCRSRGGDAGLVRPQRLPPR